MAKIGNYNVKKQIGEGGFGRVFQAEHVLLGEQACLKQNIIASKDNVDLLRHEAKLLWKLHEYHSIPAIRDFYELDSITGVIALSYIDGETLEEIVKKRGPLYPEDAAWISERVLGALYYAHSSGVIHSDVKPANVFVEPGKRDIKLIDFGLASYKPKSSTRPAGFTPRYAAPELMDGKPPIPETDMYGVGITMLYALGGDVAKKSFRSDTPKELVEFCNNLLKYNPRERPNWENGNPLEALGDVREKVFGRRHLGVTAPTSKKLKGGVK